MGLFNSENKSRKKRAQWTSNYGFIAATASSVIGLGSIWKFPYLAGQNGGGAFVIVYIICALTIGFALLLAEFSIGRAGGLNAVGSLRKLGGKWWSFAGLVGVVASFFILSFYSVIGGWVLNYVFQNIHLSSALAQDSTAYFSEFISGTWKPIFWHFVFLLLTAVVVAKGVNKGIEKVSKILLPSLFVILFIVMVKALTLGGAREGIEYLITPDFSKITFDVIVIAVGQVFFSLSIGLGCLVTYGSYLNKSENLQSNAIIVLLLDTLASIMASMIVMPAVFAFNYEPGSGPGLMFITLTNVFNKMTFGNFFGFLFFFVTFLTAIASAISLLEVMVAFFVDQFKFKRLKALLIITPIVFVSGIVISLSFGLLSDVLLFGKNIYEIVDYFSSNILLPLSGLLIAIFVGYSWGIGKAKLEITNEGKFAFPLRGFFAIIIRFVAPLAVLLVLLDMLDVI